jgi:hypothetical protein
VQSPPTPLQYFITLTASFLSADTNCYGAPFTFLNNSTLLSGTISSTNFYFGMGTPTKSFNPQAFNFPVYGSYKVRMSTSTTDGCKDSVEKTIQVFPKPHSDFLRQKQM